MPFNNFESRHFDEAVITEINTALSSLETLLAEKAANLTPEERQSMGSINEQNKLLVNKVKDYHDGQPALSSMDVDWTEFDADHASRAFIGNLLSRINALRIGMDNARILHDHDNYQAALTDYDYTQYKNKSGAVGYEDKENELKQFFPRTASNNNDTEG